MKHTILLFSFLLILASCKNDATDNNTDGDTTESTTSDLVEDRSNEEIKPEEKEEILSSLDDDEEVKIDENAQENLTNLENFDVEAAKKDAVEAKEQRKKIVNEQIDKSVNKGKTCDQLLSEYEKVVLKFIETEDDAVLDPLIEWSNDPFFNACKKDAAFKNKIDELDEKMSEVDF